MPRRHWLIDHIDIVLPALPARLEGLRIAHLTDLHIEKKRDRYTDAAAALEHEPVDLVFLTGDYISWPENEGVGVEVMAALTAQLRARLGVYGVFGNHDTPTFRARCIELPGVTWLDGHAVRDADHDLEIFGFDMNLGRHPDAVMQAHHWHAETTHEQGQARVAGAESAKPRKPVRTSTVPVLRGPPGGSPGHPTISDTGTSSASRPLRLLLSHLPTMLPTAADMGMDIMFSGHTHGGQCRIPFGFALINSTDMPLHLTSGILRHQNTLAVISRGLGEVKLQLRAFCKPHLPIYTLRQGPELGAHTHHVVNLRKW